MPAPPGSDPIPSLCCALLRSAPLPGARQLMGCWSSGLAWVTAACGGLSAQGRRGGDAKEQRPPLAPLLLSSAGSEGRGAVLCSVSCCSARSPPCPSLLGRPADSGLWWGEVGLTPPALFFTPGFICRHSPGNGHRRASGAAAAAEEQQRDSLAAAAPLPCVRPAPPASTRHRSDSEGSRGWVPDKVYG